MMSSWISVDDYGFYSLSILRDGPNSDTLYSLPLVADNRSEADSEAVRIAAGLESLYDEPVRVCRGALCPSPP